VLFYFLSFFVAAFSGGTLSVVGKHVRARGTILEVFFLTQLALLGGLLSLLAFGAHEGHELSALVSIVLSYIGGKAVVHKVRATLVDMNMFMIGGYLVLISFQYLLVGMFPQLDSHMSSGFLGNLVTASTTENYFLIACCASLLVLYTLFSRQINRRTIEQSIFMENSSKDSWVFGFFLFSLPIIASLYCLGFLYTMSYLLLPTLLAGRSFSSEKSAVLVCSVVAAISSIVGLYLSITFERLSTTSTQILVLLLLLTLTVLCAQLVVKRRIILP
jgi:zinc transport system permease protein